MTTLPFDCKLMYNFLSCLFSLSSCQLYIFSNAALSDKQLRHIPVCTKTGKLLSTDLQQRLQLLGILGVCLFIDLVLPAAS